MPASTVPDFVLDLESFIHEYYSAWEGADEDRIMSYHADNVVLQIAGTLMEGKEAFRDQFVRPFITAFPGNRHLVKNMVCGLGVVAVEFSFEAKHKGPFAGYVATGAQVKIPGCGVYEYDSTKRQITAGRIYLDLGPLLQTPVYDRKNAAEALRRSERELQMITDGESLTDILNHLCTSVDHQIYPSITTIMLMDPDGKRLWPGAGPRVPPDWRRAITPLPVAPDTGLCGTAAFLKTRVIVPDIATEPIWAEGEYRDVALKNGIRAGWSQPILTKDNEVLGTFAIYPAESTVPTADDLALIEAAGRIARIAIERQRSQDALRTALDEVKNSEAKLRRVIDAIPALAWCNLPDGPNEFLNKGWHQYTGLSPEQSHGWGWQAAFHPEDLPSLMKKWLKMLASREPDEIEARLRRHDGGYRWFLVRYHPLLDEQGRIDRWYGAAFDIEDRKQAEDARARQAGVQADVSAAFSRPTHLGEILRGCAEAIVRHLDAAFARIWMLNKDESMLELQASAGMYTRLDGSYRRIPVGDLKVGWIAREKKAHLTNDVMNDPRVNDKSWAQYNGMVAFAGYPLLVEDRLIGVVALFARHPLSESILGTLASVADTIAQGIERKRAEEALRNALDEIQKSESKLQQVIDTIPALAWCNLPDGPNEFLSKGWHDYTGLSPEESHGWGWQAAFHPDDLPSLMDTWMKMLASGESDEIEARLRRHDGVYRWFLIRAEPFRDESGTILRWYGTSTDIDDRKRAEAEVERAYLHLAEAQRLSQTGSFSWRVETDEITWSDEVYRIFQFEQGMPVTLELIGSRVHPEDQAKLNDMIEQVRKRASDFEYEHRLLMPGGSVKYLHLTAHGISDSEARLEYIGACQDVTESKVAEEALTRARSELAHMARVTTLSALTASIGHEINQPIAAAIASAGACLRWLNRDQPEVERAREAAMRIEDDGKRAAEIITRLKSFYKKDVSPQREMVSVNDVVGEMLVLLRSEADRHSVVMRTELAADLPSVIADRVLLQQVLMNLMLNGMEAMSERGGELKVSTRCEGGEVMVSVSDRGPGIPADKMEQIFNAFFTTKTGGTGMGLAISRTIIESHGGRLWVTKNPGPGATFYFTLPTEPGTV